LTATFILPRVPPDKRDLIIRNWSRQLLHVFNIRLITHGPVPGPDTAGIMFVANHVSWIDIHAINAVRPVRFIAMAEIRQWPVFGWLAAQANTLFTDRARRHDAGRIVAITAESLRAGDCLCYFPEGTTSDGNTLKPFKNSLMQAAINAHAAICPVAIRYPDSDGTINTELSYANVSLLQSVCKVLAQQAPVVEIFFGEATEVAGQDRHEVSTRARDFISHRLRLDG
jgi:1-acyl-sn-glycerol-3-phosphate acyltransferase